MAQPTPTPALEGWKAYCSSCTEDREFDLRLEADAVTQEPYYEYVCRECATILITLSPPLA